MARSKITDALVKLTQVLCESQELRSWFLGLRAVELSDRMNAFNSMARRMKEEGEDEWLVGAVRSLAQPEIYRAVMAAVEEQGR